MAKALVRVNTDKNHPYDVNDVVVVVDDDHIFGLKELDAEVFKVIELTGKTAKELRYLTSPNLESPIKLMPPAFKMNPKLMFKYLLGKEDPMSRGLINQRRYKIENKQIIDKKDK